MQNLPPVAMIGRMRSLFERLDSAGTQHVEVASITALHGGDVTGLMKPLHEEKKTHISAASNYQRVVSLGDFIEFCEDLLDMQGPLIAGRFFRHLEVSLQVWAGISGEVPLPKRDPRVGLNLDEAMRVRDLFYALDTKGEDPVIKLEVLIPFNIEYSMYINTSFFKASTYALLFQIPFCYLLDAMKTSNDLLN